MTINTIDTTRVVASWPIRFCVRLSDAPCPFLLNDDTLAKHAVGPVPRS
jgi:hypothetical protein